MKNGFFKGHGLGNDYIAVSALSFFCGCVYTILGDRDGLYLGSGTGRLAEF